MTYPDNRIAALERRIEELEAKYERLETIASMQPEPQHGDVRVGTAANDLSQALIVDGEAIPPGCVPPPLEGPLGDDPCIDLSGEAPATVLCKGRKVSLQEAAEIAMRTLADAERGRDEAATIHLVRRSPESAAVYWREQWEKMHAEVVSLRAQPAARPVVAARMNLMEPDMEQVIGSCGRCHSCNGPLKTVLDGEEWCDQCQAYRRYRSHGWSRADADHCDSPCRTGRLAEHGYRCIGCGIHFSLPAGALKPLRCKACFNLWVSAGRE